MNNKTREAIVKHGERLQDIFGLSGDPVALCKKLHRLEVKGRSLAVRMCNAPGVPEDESDNVKDAILQSVDKILSYVSKGIPVFFNSDPRGNCLKIESEWISDNRSHGDKSRSAKNATPCTANDMTFGGRCMSCGWESKRGEAVNAFYRDWGGYGIIAPDLTE
jgi:hypothetical protein